MKPSKPYKTHRLFQKALSQPEPKFFSQDREDSPRKLLAFEEHEEQICQKKRENLQRELRELLKKPHDPSAADYDPRPGPELAKKVNFFYDAYNKETSLARHMKFTDPEPITLGFGKTWKSFYDLVFTMD